MRSTGWVELADCCLLLARSSTYKHAQMLVEELDVAVIDTLGDLLSNLMRGSPLDHIELQYESVWGDGAGG